MLWNLVVVSKNNLQWSGLPTFSSSSLLIIKVEKTLDKKTKFKYLSGVFGMFLFFGILQSMWLFADMRIK